MENINQDNLLSFLETNEIKKDICNHKTYREWNNFTPNFSPELIKIGKIEQGDNPITEGQYWGVDASINLSNYPYSFSEIHQCPKCKTLFFHYLEDGGHGTQKRFRVIRKKLIDINSIKPINKCVIESKPYEYYLSKKSDLTYELRIIRLIGPGIEIISKLNKDEVSNYLKNGFKIFENKIIDMEENYNNYEILSWR